MTHHLTHLVTVPPNTHQKVIGLDVSMNKVLVMYIFNPSYHLRGAS